MPQSTPIEARSLLSLTNLATNPPAYPRNPTQKPLDPLVLYIVRVPGSKDVFLSPLKPPTKSSVSLESLNASLYYLHVAGPDDETVLETIEQEQRANVQRMQKEAAATSSKFAFLNRVRRKPAPGTTTTDGPAASTTDNQDEGSLPRPPPRPSVQGDDTAKRVGFGQDQGRGQPPGNGVPSKSPLLHPRPLPPLPAGNETHLAPPQAPFHAENNSRDERRGSVPSSIRSPMQKSLRPPPSIPDQGSAGRASWDGGRRPFFAGSPNNRVPLTPPGEPRGGFSKPRQEYDKQQKLPWSPRFPFYITLIRRDPTHGHQWNVGTITNGSGTAPSEIAIDGAITVEITTPGYKRFAQDNNIPLSLESLGVSSLSALRDSMPRPYSADSSSMNPLSSSTTTANPTNPPRFVRKVAAPRKPTTPNSRPHQPHHSRHHSSRDIPNLNHALQTGHPTKSAAGHYTFKSPWNGTCTFTTGTNGRSLKCRHVIPTTSTTTSAGGPSSAHDATDPSPAVPISEIRFNLPTFGPLPHSTTSPHRQHGRSPSASGSWDPSHSTTYQPEPGRLDLRLARERAGGGLRGKSAKLGKLIIEDEGLKMLDLVVAACMGVWWGFYEQGQ